MSKGQKVVNDGEKGRQHPTPPPHRAHHRPGKHVVGVHPRGLVERNVQLLGVIWQQRQLLLSPECGFSCTAVYRPMQAYQSN